MPAPLSKAQREHMMRALRAGHSTASTALLLGVSRQTVWRFRRAAAAAAPSASTKDGWLSPHHLKSLLVRVFIIYLNFFLEQNKLAIK